MITYAVGYILLVPFLLWLMRRVARDEQRREGRGK